MTSTRLVWLVVLSVAGGLRAQTLPEFKTISLGSGSDTVHVAEALEVGDVDGDGQSDIAVRYEAAPIGTSSFTRYVDLFCGQDFSLIRNLITWPATGTPFIHRLASLADLDGDGLVEVGVIMRGNEVEAANPSGPLPLRLRVFGGATGAIQWTTALSVANATTAPPEPPIMIADQDGDGLPDIVTTVPVLPLSFLGDPTEARVRWIKGTDGTVLHEVMDPSFLLRDVVRVGDLDGDGHEELAFLAPRADYLAPNGGAVGLMSGATREFIHFWGGSSEDDNLGTSAMPLGDRDGDGIIDLGITTAFALNVRVYSGATYQYIETIPFAEATVGDGRRFLRYRPMDWDGDGVDDYFFSRGGSFHGEARSGVDLAYIADLSGRPIPDQNGDAVPESFVFGIGEPLRITTHRGARSFGNVTGSLSLEWIPFSTAPAFGRLLIDGGSASGTATLAASFAAADPSFPLFGVPVLLSPAPEDVITILDVPLDAQGRWEFSLSLRNPAIDGTIVYLQAFAATPLPSSSAGLELLFSD